MNNEINKQGAVLVGVMRKSSEADACRSSMDELSRLLDTAGGHEVCRMIQLKPTLDSATCIGSGKVEELAEICRINDVGLAVFDTELSPSQIRNVEDKLDGVQVIDRNMLILDIFALHAVSGEGKLQVELAQLKYTAPRLIGKGASLSRQEGRIGSRGPGESQLEIDRRHIKRRIESLEAEIAEMEKNRATMRAARDRSGLTKIAIVGYTNAGKSTLLNTLTNAGVLSEDKLFATLDPTTRRLDLPDGESVLLTDTVGFIRNLPHQLVKAFKSTLDEAVYADIILILADITDPECAEQLKVTRELLKSLGAADKPTIVAYNKADGKCDENVMCDDGYTVKISARNGEGIETLLETLKKIISESKADYRLFFGYDDSGKLNSLYADATVKSTEYTENGTEVIAVLNKKCVGKYQNYIKNKI